MAEFNIKDLTADQQEKFNTVYKQLKDDYTKYLDYKLHKLHLPDPSENYLSQDDYLKDEENEWKFMIYRYLRARKWNISHTLKAIRDTIQWRVENKIDRILLDTSPEDINLSRQYVPFANHGFTKQHNPLYIEKTGKNLPYLTKNSTCESLFIALIIAMRFFFYDRCIEKLRYTQSC